ncbi:TPA: hypothetical protein PIX54_002712 [Staphylococcus aureus]|nr:hypothetical protein [Staphylococcus aureus]HDH4201824.1 hypothetical protein [Staphylococcus aureus]HDH4500443.1 hypothetical protein [Staphylococcus aureus]HDH4634244.1 hypothetical protein [Staphylococcus aureus]HDH4636988.1 hypothetical protein [Staphylococcus aureus]
MHVINPELPEPYKYETDYRKIPKELLNSNIPKGRDKVKWAPFNTVSDQYKLLDEYIVEQNKVDLFEHVMVVTSKNRKTKSKPPV